MKKIIHNGYFLSNIFLKNLKNKDYEIIEFVNKNKNKNKLYNHLLGFIYLFMTIIYKKTLYVCCNKKKDDVILFSIDEIELLPYLVWKYRKSKNISLWLWNPTIKLLKNKYERSLYIYMLKITNISIWTFDANDAKKYFFNYHPQIYSKSLVNDYKHSGLLEYDILFIGHDKNRLKELKKIKEKLNLFDLKTFLYIIPDNNKVYSIEDKKLMQEKILSYDEVLKLISKSKCIIDLVQSGQEGASLRELEALFFNKKLISNRVNIDKSFSDKNILSLENFYDNPKIIKSFLNSEHQQNSNIEKNDIEYLIKRIFN
ncbi:hypothetical protein [Acinetobacter ursingii]|uniref:hypothetical protein n=1 Tax=Acinetobacter ursingii TaxID=108980 RepID=UPI000F70693F|nr:hypothetical protein [Acinetobacter ursingii]BBF77217.1 lipopolysaccharide core biosynthesis protein RfaS [Acinetobacter ursingii]